MRLVIQMDEKLRQRSDLERMVRCNLPNQMMEMNIGMTEEKKSVRYIFSTLTKSGQSISVETIWFETDFG